ncbi:MAG TPA: MFS transporter [Acidimicrobiia bacterium]|nr:MFS transporter [Acidimicrobiia bacterium]
MKPMRLLLPVDRFNPHDRAVALTMWAVGVVQGFGQAHPSVTLPFTRAGLGLSPAEMSAVLAVARLASLAALVFAFVGDRRGRRRPLLAAYVLILAGNGLAAASSSPAGFTVSQSLVRIATSAISALGVVWLAEHLSPRVRAYGISIYGAAGSFGAALALLGLPLAERDWRFPYLLTLLGLLLLPVLSRRLEESPLLPAAPSPVRTVRGDLRHVRTEMTAGQFWIAALAGLLASAFSAVGLAFSTERLVGGLGLSTGTAVMITLAGGTLGGLGFFLGGRMSDAWGRRPTTVLSLLMILGGGLTLYQAEAVPLLVGAIVVSSFGSFAYIPSAATHRAELFPTSVRASMASALAWLGTLGSALGLAVGRLTIDTMGLAGTMTLLGTGMVAAVALTLALPETRARHLDAGAGAAPPIDKDYSPPGDQGGSRPPHPR